MDHLIFPKSALDAAKDGRFEDPSVFAFREDVFTSPGWTKHGLAIIDGLPVEEPQLADQCATAASSALGRLLPQDGAGQLVREVKYRGVKLGEGATGRYSDSREGGQFHTDGPHRPDTAPDWFALLCIRQAKVGGGLILVPTEEIIRGLDPESLAVLQEPFLFDQREAGVPPVPRPVLEHQPDGCWHVNYLREYIELGHKHPLGTPLTDQQVHALDRFDQEVASAVAAPDRIEVKLAPGQLAVIDNRRLLHGRTTFGDDPQDRDRLMLRTWIRELAPVGAAVAAPSAAVVSDR
ncbi:TauD/TfdA family dioxygenase [Arthrobacter sp. 2MCAF14]|uniref:TauD/TfdA family dioxygenase n=1 Tax=Arthrobacter sp. 2MCAF14 TaxID=3232982 RepID=UPI003F91D6F8